MFKINRITEYSLIALQHLSRNPHCSTSAREISEHYDLPFEITAKTLQRLKDTGIIQSVQGAHGGYTLARPLQEIRLFEFLSLMEGPHSVILCAGATPKAIENNLGAFQNCEHPCEYERKCEIKPLLQNLNHLFYDFLQKIRLSELISPPTFQPQNAVETSP